MNGLGYAEALEDRPRSQIIRGEAEKGDWHILYASITLLSVGATALGVLSQPSLTVFYLVNLFTQICLVWLCISLREDQSLAVGKMLLCLWFAMNLLRGVQLTNADYTGNLRVYLYTLRDSDLTSGALIVFLFTFAVTIGSHFRVGGTVLPIHKLFHFPMFQRDQILPLTLVTIVLSYLAISLSTSGDLLSAKRVYEISNGDTTRFGPITFAMIALMFYILGLSYYVIEKNEKIRYFIMCALSIALIALTINLRTYVLLVLLPLIMRTARRASFRGMVLFLFLSPIIGVFTGYVTHERNYGNASQELTIAGSLSEAVDAITLNANYGGFLSTTMSTFAIKDNAPVLYGRTLFVDPVMQFVPRSIWPNKPEELGGELRPYQQDVGILPRYIVGGVPPGIVAEAWLNGRILGVAVMGLLLGMLLQGFAAYRNQVQSLEIRATLSVIAVAIVFFWVGGHFARFVISIVQFGAAAAIVAGVQWAIAGRAR